MPAPGLSPLEQRSLDKQRGNMSRTHTFGGKWTEGKLQVLKKYLDFYVVALKAQRFELVYVDSFAGTGRCRVRAESGHKIIDGSAKIALDCEGFNSYHFIESNRHHQIELEQLLAAHPRGHLAKLACGSAADLLWPIIRYRDWSRTRGVLFLDPYGLQCTWQMVREVARTRALDVFFLVSLSGLYRNAAIDRRAVDEGKARVLTEFLGTRDWLDAVYVREQGDLFGDPLVTRAPGFAGILQFTTDRLRTEFPYVSEPRLLGQANGAPLFALYFAVANPAPQAVALARRVSEDILRDLD
jgi:three-Cys-motif partner protein